ncbi:MAG: hypothetical protein AB7I30_20345, partial [Isosphaeraceae bacterium]
MLRFPSLEALTLALHSGMIPEEVSIAPAVAVFEPGGAVRVAPSRALTRSAKTALGKIGVAACEPTELPELPRERPHCWPQLVPAHRDRSAESVGPTTPVLFDLPGRLVPELCAEVLRLGNDRQGLRWLAEDGAESTRALLRVVGPPYYALLRAIDRGDEDVGPRAFVERAPHVWVEMGYAHPWAARLRTPPGKLLLIGHPRRWEFLEEGPFRDLYEVAEITLPDPVIPVRDVEPTEKIRVVPRLARGGAPDPADLWVIDG